MRVKMCFAGVEYQDCEAVQKATENDVTEALAKMQKKLIHRESAKWNQRKRKKNNNKGNKTDKYRIQLVKQSKI